MVNFTKSLARIVGRHIVINAVAPGPTVSQMFDALPQERKDATVASAYAGRAANPEEIADVVAWLGSSRRCTSTARAWTRTADFTRGAS